MQHTGTVSSSIANLVKTIVGAGLLAVPYAFCKDGIFVGCLLTLLAAVTSGFGLFLLSKCSKTLLNPRHSSFFTLCMLTYPSLSPIFDLAMCVQCFGVGLSYLVLVGDLFPALFGGHRDYWIALSPLIIAPLSLLKKLDSLRYSSYLGLFALVYITLLVFSFFLKDVIFTDGYQDIRGDVYWLYVYDGKGLLSTFSIIIFAYVGAMNMFTIINELKDNSMKNIKVILCVSVSISTLFFLVVGVSGYLTFGSNTAGNILLNYNPDSIWVQLAKLCLGSMVILSFPLLFHPLRIAVNNFVLWFELKKNRTDQELQDSSHDATITSHPISLSVDDDENRSLEGNIYQDVDNIPEEPELDLDQQIPTEDNPYHIEMTAKRFYIISALLLMLLYGLAFKVQSFALVLSLVGATGSTSISFILPGLFGYKLIGSDSLAIGRMIPSNEVRLKKLSLLLIWFGVIVMFLSLYTTLAAT